MKKYLTIIMMLLLLPMVHGATIDLTKTVSDTGDLNNMTTFGLSVDGLEYTVQLKDNVLQKIELNGDEETEFEVVTTKQEIMSFVTQYNQLTLVQKVNLLMNNFGVPLNYLMKVMIW